MRAALAGLAVAHHGRRLRAEAASDLLAFVRRRPELAGDQRFDVELPAIEVVFDAQCASGDCDKGAGMYAPNTEVPDYALCGK